MNKPKSKSQYDKEMRRILKLAKSGDDLNKLSGFDVEIAVMCSNRGYMTEPKYQERTENGQMHAEFVDPTVTPEGMVFLENKHPNARANLAIVIASISLLVTLLANLGNIIQSVDMIIEYRRQYNENQSTQVQ